MIAQDESVALHALMEKIGFLCEEEPLARVYAALSMLLGGFAAVKPDANDDYFNDFMDIVEDVARDAFDECVGNIHHSAQ